MSTREQSINIGSLTDWQQTPQGLSGKTTHGQFSISFYQEGIVKVSATRQDSFDDFSYATIASPVAVPTAQFTDCGDYFSLTLPTLEVQIHKTPFRIAFYTPDQQIINEDDTLGTRWIGDQVTTYKKLQEGERFIGLGEKTGPLDRRGKGYQNWNTDAYSYHGGTDPLYCTIPFYIGIHHELTYGIFMDNPYKSFYNFGASNNRFASFSADCGDMHYYFIHAPSVGEIIRLYTHLTGRTPLPPRWSIGYQQCRYSYYPEKEVMTLAQTFRDKDIPCDVIVLDIHYMDRYKIFTWHPTHFPNPKALIDHLKAAGFEVVVICDPGIKKEPGYHAYDDGQREDIFIRYPDEQPYEGDVWPGTCHFPDFTLPRARQWWGQHLKTYTDLGIAGFWNDMNEIATWGNMVPELIAMNFDGNPATMRKGRNVYGFQMARSTYEGAKTHLQDRRPFNLTRSGFSGVQRYGAVWTGDNSSYDEHMMLGVRMVNSMGLSGISFAGYDVGGFVGECNGRLFARWISIGAFSPLFRGHTMINTSDAEPWSYGEETEQMARNYIKFRYQLMPYLYAVFYEASQTGMPVQRSLAINAPHDARVYDGQFQNEYLLGPYFLVCPVESDKKFVKVYFPQGEWYSLYDGHLYPGQTEVIVECPLQRLPVFVKAGAIVPMQAAAPHTNTLPDTLFLHIYAGYAADEFTYYDDDGTTFAHEQGIFHRRKIAYMGTSHQVTLAPAEGAYASPVKILKLVLHGLESGLHHVRVNGETYPLEATVNNFFNDMEKYDPFFDPAPAPTEPVHVVTVPYQTEAIDISW